MKFWSRLKRLWALSSEPEPVKAAEPKKPDLRHAWRDLASWPAPAKIQTFALPKPMRGVIPEGAKLATDSAVQPIYDYVGIYGQYGAYGFGEGLGFPGYAYLAELTQRPEYRRPAETIAKDMTRKWMRLVSTGEDDEDAGNSTASRAKDIKRRYREADPADRDLIAQLQQEWLALFEESHGEDSKAEKIKAIEEEFKRLGVQKLFREAAEQDGWYGRSQIWLETCTPDDAAELKMPLDLTNRKIGKGDLKSLRVVEPIWTYPGDYNAVNPLREDFFKPTNWYVMGQTVHSTRLLTFISRPMPDLLKPAYQFGGLSLSQMLKPYVDNWLRTRQSVSDAISNFSIMVLLTDLAQTLETGGTDALMVRAQAFNKLRDNNGLMLGDKNSEDLKNVAMPLGSLDKLQAQSQEHMSGVTGLPLIKAFGITPTGLNASSEGELKAYDVFIESMQEAMFTPNLTYLLHATQLSLFGEIDPSIGFVWEPLWSLTELELANVDKIKAETDEIRINSGVIDATEARAALAAQEESPYAGLDLDKEIAPLEQPGDDDDMNGLAAMLSGGGEQHDGQTA